jgi:hypothetical protein
LAILVNRLEVRCLIANFRFCRFHGFNG